jgi:hypothetical protein
MSVRVFYEILNQRGTPAMFTDTLANRPAFGFAGRLFVSTDSGQIFEDTGSAWTLVADAGVGGGTLSSVCLNGNTTATGIVITAGGLSTNSLTDTALTAGSILYAGSGGLISQSNSTFFWDATNNRLGIGINSPGAPLDIHATGTNAQFNGTGTNNAYLQFQNAGVSKWRIGNTYNAGANSFDIYNNGLASTPLSISSSTNAITINGNINTGSFNIATNSLSVVIESYFNRNILLNKAGLTTTNLLYITQFAASSGVGIGYSDGTGGANFTFPTASISTYTFPAATGTLALTSNLSSYLPLTGGTLTGQLYINPTNTATTGLDVASDTISFRSDNLEGFKRQLLITMGSGTLIKFQAQGYGANYGTDLGLFTATTSGANSAPAIYMSSSNIIGFGTGATTEGSQPSGTLAIIPFSSVSSGPLLQFSGNGRIRPASTGDRLSIDGNALVLNGTFGNNVLIGTTTDNGNKLQVEGKISYSQSLIPTASVNGGYFTIDSTGTTFSLGSLGAVNIGSFSGMALITNLANGVTMLFLCGGGFGVLVSQSTAGAAGTMTNFGGSGYTFTTAYTSTTTYTFQLFRTRTIS